MAFIPQKMKISKSYRVILNAVEKRVHVLNVNPSIYQVFGVMLSIIFFYKPTVVIQSILIAIILLLDWLDGFTARQYKTITLSGYMIDVVIDRFSEGIIFFSFIGTTVGNLFYILWLCNVILSYVSIHKHIHISFPLRFMYLIYLIGTLIWH